MIGKRGKKFMRFRPCIDIHNGQVKQIVGGSLTDKNDFARENLCRSRTRPGTQSFIRRTA